MLLQLQRLEAWNQGVSGVVHAVMALGKNPSLPLPTLLALGVLWLTAAQLPSLPSSSHAFSFLWVSSHKDPCHPVQGPLHSSTTSSYFFISTAAKTYIQRRTFPNKVTLWGSGWTQIWGGGNYWIHCTIQHTYSCEQDGKIWIKWKSFKKIIDWWICIHCF